MVFVDSLDAPELSDEDRHHVARVLRVRAGDPMVVCDGAGRWRRANFGSSLLVDGDVEVVPVPSPALTVGFALTKGDRPELVVQKLTELGIDRIAPFTSDHCVVRPDAARARRQVERLRRVAREAAMQCRRTHLPVVDDVSTFDEVVDGIGGGVPPVLADVGDEADRVAPVAITESSVVLIGPEGGWSSDERGRGLRTVRLGVHVLRAETAAIAAATLLTAARAGLTVAFDNGG